MVAVVHVKRSESGDMPWDVTRASRFDWPSRSLGIVRSDGGNKCRTFVCRSGRHTVLHNDIGGRDRDRAVQGSAPLEPFDQARRLCAVGARQLKLDPYRVEERDIGP